MRAYTHFDALAMTGDMQSAHDSSCGWDPAESFSSCRHHTQSPEHHPSKRTNRVTLPALPTAGNIGNQDRGHPLRVLGALNDWEIQLLKT